MGIDLGRLIVCFVLLIGLVLVVRQAGKVLKITPWGDDEKSDFRASMRALVYVLAAGLAVLWFVHNLGTIGTIFGIVLASLLVLTVVLTLVDLSPRLSRVDDLLWRDGPKTPGYSRSGDPVPYVRWARRAAMLLFLLFVMFAAVLSGVGSNASAQAGSSSGSTAPAIAAPTSTAPPASAPATATSSAPASTPSSAAPTTKYVDSSCDGPKQIAMVDSPSTISFGTGNLKICYSGKWQSWSAFSTTTPPKTVRLTAWVVGGSYGYGQVVDPSTGDSYIIRTTDF